MDLQGMNKIAAEVTALTDAQDTPALVNNLLAIRSTPGIEYTLTRIAIVNALVDRHPEVREAYQEWGRQETGEDHIDVIARTALAVAQD